MIFTELGMGFNLAKDMPITIRRLRQKKHDCKRHEQV